METQLVQFLLNLALTSLKCGRPADAKTLLLAIAVADPQNAEGLRLLALAQLQAGDSIECLETLDQIQRAHFDDGKQRQMTWIKIRALHQLGRLAEAKTLIDELRAEVSRSNPDTPQLQPKLNAV